MNTEASSKWVLVVGSSSESERIAETLRLVSQLEVLKMPSLREMEYTGALALIVGDSTTISRELKDKRQGLTSRTLALLTGAGDNGLVKLTELGVPACLFWPIEPYQLGHWISALASDTPTSAIPVILDHNTVAAFVGHVRAAFSRTQFGLFRYLVLNAGRWVSGQELLKNVIGGAHESDTSLVRVHIHAIRKALGTAARHLRSDPRRTRGYRFSVESEEGEYSATRASSQSKRSVAVMAPSPT